MSDDEDYADYEEEEDEEVEEPDDDDVDMSVPAHAPARAQAEVFYFSDFACPASDDDLSEINIQVVDIECQQRPRMPEFDDRRVLEAVAANLQPKPDWGGPRGDFQHPVPCMRIYGKLRDGRSVCANTYGYYPTVHVLVSVPPLPNVVADVTDALEKLLTEYDDNKRKGRPRGDSFRRILYADVRNGYPMYPYIEAPWQFIELKLALPEYIKAIGETLIDYPELVLASGARVQIKPFSCLPIVETFQADRFISGYGWINIKNWRSTDPDAQRCEPSRCDIEVDVNVDSITPYKDDLIAPQRVLAFDIECAKTVGIPKPQTNEVILIACICADYIEGNPTGKRRRVIFQYGSSDKVDSIDPDNGDLHLHFTGENAERRMLDAFGDLVRTYDPDFLVGHNLINFDLPYVVERGHVLDCNEDVLYLGRRGNYKWFPPRRFIKQRKNGDSREMTTTDTPGRTQLDTLPWIQSNTRDNRSFKLGSLGAKYLNDTKMDVSYTMIVPLWKRSDATRARLAAYCMQDTVLTMGLVDFAGNKKEPAFDMIKNAIEESRQTRVCCPRLLKAGMQARVWGRLLEKMKSPHFDAENNPVFVEYERPKARAKGDKFTGAVVLEPCRGFYPGYVVCGDFRSLYPSIIIFLNICFTTLIAAARHMELKHQTSPSGCHFVDPAVRKGLLAQMEEELMAERDEAKRMAKAEKDPGRKGMYNNRQNKIKLICNSVYGILSASGGRYVRVALGLAVTSQGRLMIMKSKEIAESDAFRDSVVRTIYGDTDSIMVSLKPHITTDEEAFTVLVYICDAVTEYFAALSTSKAVLLQAEKVMKFMIMINKKRYIAAKILATRIERDPGPKGPGTGKVTKISVAPRERIAMGVEIARRDNCLLVKETMEEVVDTIMLKNDMPGARKIVNSVLREIIGGRIDIGKLVISKSISKSDYKCDPLQVQLAIRMKERDPSYEWGLGERIPYVIVSRDHKTLADQAEDPLWAIQHGLPLDTKYYIDKQLSGPISRIFMWLPGTSDPTYMRMLSGVEEKIRASCGNQAAIDKYEKQLDKIMEKMQGHAAQILFGPGALAAHPRPKVDAGSHGIAAFFRPVAKCTRCKVGVRVNGSLCNECQPRNARCMAIGCRKSVTLETVPGIPDNYCSTCAPIMDKCPVCERLMPLSDANQGLCDNCILGRCYSCGRDDLETHYGVCPRCKDFVANRKAGMAACKVVDIEDLRRQAAEAKQECFTRCGVSTDEINCVSRECSTLLKRATLAAKIENMEKK